MDRPGRNKPDDTFVLGLVLLLGGLGLLLLIQLILLCSQGQTMGKKALGIRIVNHEDGSNPGFVGAVLMRSIVPGIIGSIPYIGGFFSLADVLFIFSDDRRCLHDKMAGTSVVEA
jgi:uncharacterized RDD family membrane protein YckC